MTERTVTFVGAAGGQGTSTVAAVFALLGSGHTSVRLTSGDAAPILGVPDALGSDVIPVSERLTLGPQDGAAEVGVIDASMRSTGAVAHDRFVVLRGPCYLAVRSLMAAQHGSIAGIVLVAEEARSLTARDVQDVSGLDVVARILVTARVARTIDAGLLVSRLHALSEFNELRRLARGLLGPREQAAA
jgi:hypothetical protein